MANSVIILKPAADAPVDSTLLELTLRATDATPEDIILYPRPSLAAAGLAIITLVAMGITDTWPSVNAVTGGIEWYQDGFKYIGSLSGGSAVFPPVGDVDLGIVFGPTGTDYTGTSVNPAEADVRSGTTYGASGTEFTGTLVAGGGSTGPFMDIDTGSLYTALNTLLILKL